MLFVNPNLLFSVILISRAKSLVTNISCVMNTSQTFLCFLLVQIFMIILYMSVDTFFSKTRYWKKLLLFNGNFWLFVPGSLIDVHIVVVVFFYDLLFENDVLFSE